MAGSFGIDEIGLWTEVKLDILKRYATAYSQILSKQKNLTHVYIDAFAGAGIHFSKTSKEMVPGSPLNALLVEPPFKEHYLIDLNGDRVEGLRLLAGGRKDVHLFHGDCNEILLKEVFPKVRFQDFRRGLCLLDPYKMTLDWKVIAEAGSMQSLDIFVNFPIMTINRNVLRHDRSSVTEANLASMNACWGDESWKDIAYAKSRNLNLFDDEDTEKVSNQQFAEAFRQRLKKVAGFRNVPEPLAMRNSTSAIVYYLFFASQKDTAEHVVSYIFKKFGEQRM